MTQQRIERSLNEAKEQLEEAATEEQFQTIGLLCRETLISLAQVIYDPALHPRTDDVTPSKTDAKRMLEAYLKHELRGKTHEAARMYARSALDLANALQHKRTASFRDAALCIEATTAVVKVIGIISGQLELASHEPSFKKVLSQMPELIADMKECLTGDGNEFIREFFIASKSWHMNSAIPRFIFYFEDHDNLPGKIQILENYGFLNVTIPHNTKIYRMTEEFVKLVLAS